MTLPSPVGWLFDVLGIKDVFDALGGAYPRRQQVRFLGATIADNPTLGTTDVQIGGAIVQGAVSTGAHVYDPDTTSLVWNRSSVTAGCFWRIGLHTLRQSIRFTSFATDNAISIHDPLDNVLGSILYTSGNIYSVEIYYDGSTFQVVDQKVKP